MKKFTKITALALALALVLGMSAFADAPTNIVYTEFADTIVDGVPSLVTYKANRNEVTRTALGGWTNNLSAYANAIDGETAGSFATTYYTFDGAETLAAKDGVATLTLPNTAYNRLIWDFNNNLTMNSESTKGLAMSFDVKMDAAPGTNKQAWVLVHYLDGTTEGNTQHAGLNGNDFTSGGNNNGIGPVNVGVKNNVTVALAPISNTGVVDNYVYAHAWTNHSGRGAHSRKAVLTNSRAVTITGMQINNWNFATMELSDIIFYEVSTNGDDICFENDPVENLAADDELEIIVSQPVMDTEYNTVSAGVTTAYSTIADNLVITKEGVVEPLVAGLDYTATVGQKIDGTEVKGVIKIKMLYGMDYGTTYTVTANANALQNMVSVKNTQQQTATFTTMPAPKYNVSLNAYKGFVKNDAGITDLSTVNTGETVCFEAIAQYVNEDNRGTAGDGIIVIGVYEGDNLVKCVTTTNNFVAKNSESLIAAFKISAGQTVKAFVKGVSDSVNVFGE